MNKGTIIRTLVLILAFVNHALTIAGKNPLPFDDAMIEQMVAFGFDFVASVVAWWKNNDFTEEACVGTGMTRLLKAKEKGKVVGENFFDEAEEVE